MNGCKSAVMNWNMMNTAATTAKAIAHRGIEANQIR